MYESHGADKFSCCRPISMPILHLRTLATHDLKGFTAVSSVTGVTADACAERRGVLREPDADFSLLTMYHVCSVDDLSLSRKTRTARIPLALTLVRGGRSYLDHDKDLSEGCREVVDIF